MKRNLLEDYKIYDHIDSINKVARLNGYAKRIPFMSRHIEKESLEEKLAQWIPDYQSNPDYIAIKAFQEELQKEEKRRKEQAVKKIRSMLPVYFDCQTVEEQAVALRELGMRVIDVVKVIGKTKGWYCHHCQDLVRKPARVYDLLTIACDMEEELREARLWKQGVKVC